MKRRSCNFSTKKMLLLMIPALLLCIMFAIPVQAKKELSEFDRSVLNWANECAKKVSEQFNHAITSGTLKSGQIFDTLHVPIHNTYPQKYETQYDKYSDKTIRPIIDSYEEKNERIAFVILVDRYGYNPTHNTKYSKPITGDSNHDAKWNRTKRIFNDETGLAAAVNTDPYLLQRYSRDTGEEMRDLSVPIYINNEHWGAIRVGYK